MNEYYRMIQIGVAGHVRGNQTDTHEYKYNLNMSIILQTVTRDLNATRVTSKALKCYQKQ